MFFDISSMEYKKKRDGVFYKDITGKKVQMAFVRLDPGVETHNSHRQEQMGYILMGEVELTVGEGSKKLSHGDAYYIPVGKPHGFKVVGDACLEYIEIFSPPKEENR